MNQNNLWITHKQMILTPDVMEDGLVHMVYADEVSGNVLILIVDQIALRIDFTILIFLSSVSPIWTTPVLFH